MKLRSFKNSEHENEKGDVPYRGLGYLTLFSYPIDYLATWSCFALYSRCNVFFYALWFIYSLVFGLTLDYFIE